MTETERLLNRGKEVKISEDEVCRVFEPPLEALLLMTSKIGDLAGIVEKSQTGELTEQQMMLRVISDPAALELIKDLAVVCTDQEKAFFNNRPTSEWLRLIVGAKEAINLEEIKRLFLQVVPEKIMSRFQQEA